MDNQKLPIKFDYLLLIIEMLFDYAPYATHHTHRYASDWIKGTH